MYTSQILPKLILGVAFLLVTTAATAAQSPSGSVAFETAEGSTTGDTLWTGCTVLFKGKLSTCTLSGLSAPVTGLARVSGMVYGLKVEIAWAVGKEAQKAGVAPITAAEEFRSRLM